jgi:hypothetical protein
MSPSDQLGAERATRLLPAVPLSCIDTRAGNRPVLFLDVDGQLIPIGG